MDSNAENKGALFMWKLKEVRKAGVSQGSDGGQDNTGQ